MSSAQKHLSVICAKIPSATSGSNKGVKIVPKALSGAIARQLGGRKILRNASQWSSGRGLTSGTSFEPVREKWPAQVLGRAGYCGLMGA